MLQPLLGEAAEPRQPQLEKRLEALYLVRVDAVVQNVSLVVGDGSVIVLHPSVSW
jgi:hypothetical protein